MLQNSAKMLLKNILSIPPTRPPLSLEGCWRRLYWHAIRVKLYDEGFFFLLLMCCCSPKWELFFSAYFLAHVCAPRTQSWLHVHRHELWIYMVDIGEDQNRLRKTPIMPDILSTVRQCETMPKHKPSRGRCIKFYISWSSAKTLSSL